MAKGNVGTAISIVSLDTLLSPIIVPATLLMMFGEKVGMDASSLIVGLLTDSAKAQVREQGESGFNMG